MLGRCGFAAGAGRGGAWRQGAGACEVLARRPAAAAIAGADVSQELCACACGAAAHTPSSSSSSSSSPASSARPVGGRETVAASRSVTRWTQQPSSAGSTLRRWSHCLSRTPQSQRAATITDSTRRRTVVVVVIVLLVALRRGCDCGRAQGRQEKQSPCDCWDPWSVRHALRPQAVKPRNAVPARIELAPTAATSSTARCGAVRFVLVEAIAS